MSNQSNRTRSPRLLAVVIVATVLLAALAGAVVAKVALPQDSTAEARLVVGDQTLSAQAVPGYAVATQQLATTYARLVSSDEVARTVKGDVTSVQATAIADSAIIRVQASAANDQAALAAAKAGAQRLVDVADRSRKADSAATTMTRYNTTYRAFQTANKRLGAAKAAGDQTAIDAAQRRVAQIQLNLNSYSQLYQQQVAANGTSSASVMVMSQPVIVKQQAMRLPLLGALLGGFLMAALWALRAMLRRTRRTAAGDSGSTAAAARGRDDAAGPEQSITLPGDTPQAVTSTPSGSARP